MFNTYRCIKCIDQPHRSIYSNASSFSHEMLSPCVISLRFSVLIVLQYRASKRRGRVVRTPSFYSGGSRFKYRPSDFIFSAPRGNFRDKKLNQATQARHRRQSVIVSCTLSVVHVCLIFLSFTVPLSVKGNSLVTTAILSALEGAHIHFVCGYYVDNARAAFQEYQRWFPDSKVPDRRVFSNAHQCIKEAKMAWWKW